MRYKKSITQLIGNTPLIEIPTNGAGRVFAKLEMFNIGGSVKDRIAKQMIQEAEASGSLKKGMTIVEPTSGNTGISLALIAASKGYPIILTMPSSMSLERRNILKALGAKLVLTDSAKGMTGAVAKADAIAAQDELYFRPRQFDNPNNPLAHVRTTALEILADMENKVDIFVAGVGTGGTITGVAKVFGEKGLKTKFVAVEPSQSPVLSGGSAGPHKIQGIGAGFVPSVLETGLIDEIQRVDYEDAKKTTIELARGFGLFLGVSAGAAIFVAKEYAKSCKTEQNIVVIAPDGGEKYLSTDLFFD